MFRRRESVPFSFVAEADRFRSNVTPPPRRRVTPKPPNQASDSQAVVATGTTG